jgi:single-stranded-DNA-specific exonuclease
MSKVWKVLDAPPQLFFDEHPELPPTIAHLLYHRNIRSQRQIDEFLNPDYSVDVHDPFLFRDMKRAVSRIFLALENKEKIVIHGDYDADGVSAATILMTTLKLLGATNVDVFLPHRELDGYGINIRTIELLAKENAKVIISCDCGISNTPEIARANELGVDVIITDHHTIPEELPKAYATIHPKVEGESYPDKGLAGGGVAFKLAQGLLMTYKENNEFLPNGDHPEAVEKWLLDMVAIASVADMVPLLGESRTLTKYGLIVLNKTRRIGLQKLLLEARLLEEDGTMRREITADTIGFQIAPRINAAGRLGHANVAFQLLNTNSPTEAVDLAYQLDQNNKDRQQRTDQYVREAIAQVENGGQKENPVLFVIEKDWSTGIVGLIASRLKDKYSKPTIAMGYNEGNIVGSGRSVNGFNMIASMQEVPELFLKFGGHPMACGFTLKTPETFELFKKSIIEKYKEKTVDIDMIPTFNIDSEIKLIDVNWELYDLLDKFKPFGMHNDKPKYLARNLSIVSVDPLGADGKHMKLMVRETAGPLRKVVGWRLCGDNNGGPNWCKILRVGDKIDMVFEVDVNEWNGNRELQLSIVDLKKL